ncbi:Ligand-binding domain of nuclear hormone receptor [Paragonimus heterotremus]|uniref:Ligand-binding domain of nuclear hormone receptor n=1 Tax=Paragonimus heterotremus TaxID=100268 RepID=A0A8J4WT40_9TREM|nr:Ligand-binding domain of nuclear hormone receptor [Paragonimus heterotremus]
MTTKAHIASQPDAAVLGDGLKCATADNSVLEVCTDPGTSSVNSENESGHATHVTIQLPDGMQGSTLSQQKLQDLILQLSQTGQIQLREDSKIVIDLKFTGKSDDASAVSKAEQKLTTADASASRTPAAVASTDAIAASQTQNLAVHMKAEPIAATPVVARHQLQQQQQPTYILLPAGQISSTSEGQLYAGSNHIRTVSTGGTVLRTLGGTAVASGSGVGFGSQDRSIIVLQQPLAGSGASSGGTSSLVVSNSGPTTLVPLRQLTGVGGAGLGASGTIGRVASNTTWVAAGPNRFITSGGATELYVNSSGTMNVGQRASQNNYITISSGSASGSNASRESTWQQYVKQFTKLGPCPICGDKISGYHYGIFCCESCKGFFKRTVQNAKRYACHHPSANSVCDINVSSRKKCPACRFVKCVDKGMRIEAIRSDRTRGGRSMYPGSRYLRQIAARVGSGRSSSGTDPASTDPNNVNIMLGGRGGTDDSEHLAIVGLSGMHHTLGPDGLPSSMDAGGGVYLDPAVLGTHADDDDDDDEDAEHGTMQVDQSLLDYPGSLNLNVSSCSTPYVGRQVIVTGGAENVNRTRIELPKIISDILAVEESMESETEDTLEIDPGNTPPGASIPEGVSEDEAAVYRALLNLADQRLYRTVRWSRALPDFAQLDTDDQILLLQNCWADLLCLDCCWRSLPTPTEIRLTSSKCINLEAARELGAEDIVERMLQLTQYLTELQLDLVEYACLKVIVLMRPDLKNLKAAAHVREYQESVRQLLMDYVAKSSPTKRDKYSRLMSRIPELQITSQTARLMLIDLDLSAYLSSNSLLMELLRSDIQRYAPTGEASTNADEGNTRVDGITNSAPKCTSPEQGGTTDNGGKTMVPVGNTEMDTFESQEVGAVQGSIPSSTYDNTEVAAETDGESAAQST